MSFQGHIRRVLLKERTVQEALHGEENGLVFQYLLESQAKGAELQALVADSSRFVNPITVSAAGKVALREARQGDFEVEGKESLHDFVAWIDLEATDAYGWQYSVSDEWRRDLLAQSTERRRLWFRACCDSGDSGKMHEKARFRLYDGLSKLCGGGEVTRGELWKKGHSSSSFQKRFVVLTDNSLDYFLHNPPSVLNKRGSLLLSGYAVKALYGCQCSDRDRKFPFLLYHATDRRNHKDFIFDVSSDAERQDWLFHIQYVLKLLAPISMTTFGPAVIRDKVSNIIFRGDLQKLGHTLMSTWSTRHFELAANGTLIYYEGVQAKGSVELLDAQVNDDSASEDAEEQPSRRRSALFGGGNAAPTHQFSIKKANYTLSMRAPTREAKREWIDALRAVISPPPTVGKKTSDNPLLFSSPTSSSTKQQQHEQQQSLLDDGVGEGKEVIVSPVSHEIKSTSNNDNNTLFLFAFVVLVFGIVYLAFARRLYK